MLKKNIVVFEEAALAVLAFSVFGMLFAMRPMTWLPTLIILLSAVLVIVKPSARLRMKDVLTGDDLRLIVWPLIAWFLVCLFIGVWHLGLARKTFPDNALRMALASMTLVLFVHAMVRRAFLLGLIVGSICVILNVAYGYLVYDAYFPRISGTTNHPIHFGNFSSLLSVLLTSVALLDRSSSKIFRAACLAGAVMAFAAAATSLARSSAAVLLCLLPVVLITKTDRLHQWVIRLTTVVALCLVLAVTTSPVMQEKLRLKEAVSDIQQVEANNYRTSIGARLAMWHAGWLMFKENPFLGIGPGKFQAEFGRRIELGEVPMGDVVHGQPHNDLLHSASSGGLLKLGAYLFLMAGPFVFFHKKYKANRHDLDKRVLPIMGMQVVAAFFITGLTNSNFDLQIYSTCYAVLVVVLARLCLAESKNNNPIILGDNLS